MQPSQTELERGTRTTLIVDEEAFEDALPGAAHVSVIRTSQGSGPIVVEVVDFGGVLLAQSTSGYGVVVEAYGRDDVLVLAGAVETQRGGLWDGAPAQPGLFAAYGVSGYHVSSISEGFVGGQIVTDRGAVEDAIGVLGREPTGIEQEMTMPLPGSAAEVGDLHRFAGPGEDGFLSAQIALPIILDRVARIYSEPSESRARSGKALCSRGIVRTATEYVSVTVGQIPTVLELCRVVGVSERRLLTAFRDVFDLSPSQYLRAGVLTAVRKRLAAADQEGTTVTEVAYDHGVWHLGRFASDYRKTFGELPSETLRSNRH